MESNGVNEAFEILLAELDSVIDSLNETGAQAFQKGDYQKAQKAASEARTITEFRDKLKALQNEWIKISNEGPKIRSKIERRGKVRQTSRTLRTPEKAFRRPILEALVELGGLAMVADVLEVVERKMSGILNSYDWEPLPSRSSEIRWRNTAKWCRKQLVEEGLLKNDSPYGIWEISEKGRRWLESQGR